MTGEIKNLADLRPGDIGLMRMGGFVPGFFPVRIGQMLCKESYQIGPFSADHALICVEAELPPYGRSTAHVPPFAVQAMPRGAEEIQLIAARHWTDGVAWFRPTEDYPGQAEDAAAIARLFVSERVPYSFLSYLALAAWSRGLKAEQLERWIDRRGEEIDIQLGVPEDQTTIRLPREAICSVLVDQAWSLAGKRVVEGVKRQCVTPGKLAISLARRYPAYGPGFLASA